MIKPVLVAVSLCLFAVNAQASEALLQKFFLEVKTLEAAFEQQVVDETGMTLEVRSGRFSLSRPGKFRWDYVSEDADSELGQQIVADGHSIYNYDPDLEQVTVRSMKDAFLQVPSLLLVQQDTNLLEHFQINDLGLTDGMNWVALKPRDEDASYQQLMIAFLNERLATIVLLDGLGNETRLRLSNTLNNVALADSVFQFKVPEGADVHSQ